MKLLYQVSDVIWKKRYPIRTEQSYVPALYNDTGRAQAGRQERKYL